MSAVIIPIPPTPKPGKARCKMRTPRRWTRIRALERELNQALAQARRKEHA